MNTKTLLTFALGSALLAGCLAGGGIAAAFQGGASPAETASVQTANTSCSSLAVAAEDGGEGNISYAEVFAPYEQFGLIYDAGTNELRYNGKLVRWFEDYYPITEDTWAGMDFFDEDGVVDVYAVRDLSGDVRADGGSFDPGGILTGIEEFSEEEFAARDIDALQNPATSIAITSETAFDPAAKSFKERFAAYQEYGIEYIEAENASGTGNVYYNGKPVNTFIDISPSGGTFAFQSADGGNMNVQTVYENGMIIGVKELN